MADPNFFEKQPGESYTIEIEFLNRLPSGTSLSSGTVSATDLSTMTTDNTVLASTTATISGTKAKTKVQAGTHGKDYKITFLTTLNDSSVLEEDVEMRVRAI